LALPLCACADINKPGATTPLDRAIPTQTCEAILTPVKLPIITKATDARIAFVKDDAALLTANGRITAGRNCIANVRTHYATGK